MSNIYELKYWNNMQVEIIKNYPLFRKYKIKVIYTGVIIIVDECALTEIKEEAVSIAWLEEYNA